MISETVDYLLGLQRWQARAGFLLSSIFSRLGMNSSVCNYFKSWVHGRYTGKSGQFDLRPLTLDAWMIHPGHERATHTALREAIQPAGGVMLDVGGCCGGFSFRYHNCFDHLVIFEPFAGNISAIRKNADLTHLGAKLTLVASAVADYEGTAELFLSNNDTHSLTPSPMLKSTFVPVVTIDDTLCRLNIKFSDVRAIKIDVEGSELAVLRGAQQTLRLGAPLVICEANTAKDRDNLQHYMATLEYELRAVLDKRNLLFSPLK